MIDDEASAKNPLVSQTALLRHNLQGAHYLNPELLHHLKKQAERRSSAPRSNSLSECQPRLSPSARHAMEIFVRKVGGNMVKKTLFVNHLRSSGLDARTASNLFHILAEDSDVEVLSAGLRPGVFSDPRTLPLINKLRVILATDEELVEAEESYYNKKRSTLSNQMLSPTGRRMTMSPRHSAVASRSRLASSDSPEHARPRTRLTSANSMDARSRRLTADPAEVGFLGPARALKRRVVFHALRRVHVRDVMIEDGTLFPRKELWSWLTQGDEFNETAIGLNDVRHNLDRVRKDGLLFTDFETSGEVLGWLRKLVYAE